MKPPSTADFLPRQRTRGYRLSAVRYNSPSSAPEPGAQSSTLPPFVWERSWRGGPRGSMAVPAVMHTLQRGTETSQERGSAWQRAPTRAHFRCGALQRKALLLRSTCTSACPPSCHLPGDTNGEKPHSLHFSPQLSLK